MRTVKELKSFIDGLSDDIPVYITVETGEDSTFGEPAYQFFYAKRADQIDEENKSTNGKEDRLIISSVALF